MNCNIFTHKQRTLFGKPVQQAWQSLWVLEKLLANEKPTMIVELGTSSGMLSYYLHTYSILSGSGFMTFDINIPNYRKTYNFSQGDIHSIEVKEHVVRLFDNAIRPLLIIDASDPKSFTTNMYIPLMASGTIIAIHDFITDETKPFRWGWRENNLNCLDMIEQIQPYYSLSKKLDTRMAYYRRK